MRTQFTRVEQLIVFLFLMHHMQHQSQTIHVAEDDFPLIEFAAVETFTFVF